MEGRTPAQIFAGIAGVGAGLATPATVAPSTTRPAEV